MASNNSEFHETKEYNPVLRSINKKLFALQRYIINLLFLIAAVYLIILSRNADTVQAVISTVAAIILITVALSLRIAFEWERVPILRFGQFKKTKGPGPFFIIPVLDIPCSYVDCRINVTDFSAEKVLTKDAVPIYVDAIIFWMIWDAAKAKLEVENFLLAVPLSAKTALRDIIGKTTLSSLLTDREAIGQELQKILDSKTNPWGITALSVELKDIAVPRELENAISKEAQAEREKNARVILGSAEIELSQKYAEAAKNYKGNEEALTLRSLNLLLETVNSKGSMILVPSEIPHVMNKALSVAMAKKTGSLKQTDQDF